MPELSVLLLAACMFLGAALYTSVGHAGASAYIALMAIFGIAPAVMRPTALALNVLVASFTSFRICERAYFAGAPSGPFLLGAIPFAFLGGAIQLPGAYYRPLVGLVLLIGGARLLWPSDLATNREPRDPPILAGILCGVGIGFLSGLTGTGGGIFLSPLLLFVGWSATKPASGVAVVFILCNSIAGLLGNVAIVKALPPDLPLYAVAVVLGAVLGTTMGIRWNTPDDLEGARGRAHHCRPQADRSLLNWRGVPGATSPAGAPSLLPASATWPDIPPT